MSYDISGLEPVLLWKYFDRIRKIPRCSGNEDALSKAIISWAEKQGARAEQDGAGNIIVRIPATPGYEEVPGVVLQGHMDMVCEKNAESTFDFKTDAIELNRKGDWIEAKGTTLGADNGVGLAAALAFLEVDDISHGPIEILATVEEETGLFGALELDPEYVKGRMLFNFDSEEDGIFYVGCAGGRDTSITLPIDRRKPTGQSAYVVTVKGLKGGHSGLDIILNRGNAVILLARVLQWLVEKTPSMEISRLDGGDKHNAIPREASAVVVTPTSMDTAWIPILEKANQVFSGEYGPLEPDVEVVVQETEMPRSTFSKAAASRAVDFLLAVPNGVMAMMRDIPEVVETSNNLARVKTDDVALKILCSSRSSIDSASAAVVEKLAAICRMTSATTKELSRYPGWQPDMSSPMLAKARQVWKDVHHTEPEVKVVHAGLECGIIGEKFEGMDMISLGPTIENPHSPSERVHIPSVERFFAFAKAFIASIAEG